MTVRAEESVHVTRVLNASAEEAFDAWTNPDRMSQWLFPGSGTVAEASADPVVGGRFRIAKLFPTGVDEVTGEYLVVEPPTRLVFTWQSPGSTGARPTRVTVTLTPDGDTTQMTILHERLPAPRFRAGAEAAWSDILSKLQAHLAAHPS
ncbi:SRPBCC domain-containing protein [Nonomuraea sp. NPDC050536]|uniref:SRPBCC domain-containing protein n=1 Tax=Nonomuraea sp. NPDC050536 TaxID=3364366 RepID=UPI0037C56225